MAGNFHQPAFDFMVDSRVSRPRPRGRTNNLFLALKPPPALAGQITAETMPLAWQLDPGARLTPADRLHISLISLGIHSDPSQALLEEIRRRMSGPMGTPIQISFDRLSCFGGNAIVLRGGPTNPIRNLRRALVDRLSFLPVVYGVGRRPFEPHMTVFHSTRRFAELAIETRAWVATEVILVHSHYGHVALGTWPLAASRDSCPAHQSLQADLLG